MRIIPSQDEICITPMAITTDWGERGGRHGLEEKKNRAGKKVWGEVGSSSDILHALCFLIFGLNLTFS